MCQIFHTHSFLRLPLVGFHFQLQLVHQILESGNVFLVLFSLMAPHSKVCLRLTLKRGPSSTSCFIFKTVHTTPPCINLHMKPWKHPSTHHLNPLYPAVQGEGAGTCKLHTERRRLVVILLYSTNTALFSQSCKSSFSSQFLKWKRVKLLYKCHTCSIAI